MQANPDKFQVLAVGKKTYEKRPTINIQNFELTCEDSVKLLGIEIDYQLNFDTHIRDRPFNLQGGLWFFVSFRIYFRTTRVRIFFFVAQSANFFSKIQH